MTAIPYPISSRRIQKSVIVDSQVSEVWARWTTHDGLLTFFGVDNQVELMIGGKFEIYFLLDAPAGMRGSEGCKVLSYLDKEMLSFSWNAPPSIPEVRDHSHKAWVVVTFQTVNSVQTKVVLNHIGWLEGPKWEETFDYFDRAWSTVLDSLEKCYHV